jgi:hypothetical protein
VRFLAFAAFGLFAAEPAFGLGDLHAFAGAGTDEVGFEFGDHGQDVEQQPADGIGGVMDGTAETELHVAFGEVFDDVPGIRQGAGEAVQLLTMRVSPARTAARASRRPGRSLFRPVSPGLT